MSSLADWEPREGMLVTFPQALSIGEYFNFGRFNEIVLTSGRQFKPTAVLEPGLRRGGGAGPGQPARPDHPRRRAQLAEPRPRDPPERRDLRPHATASAAATPSRTSPACSTSPSASTGSSRPRAPTYTVGEPAAGEPDEVGGNLTVASFNVLNYFTTLDPLGRGANTAEEFERQRTKIIAAIAEIDADVVGLIEIENNEAAIEDLVDGLNAAIGAGTYAYIDTGVIGTDAIKVALRLQARRGDAGRRPRGPRLDGRPAVHRHHEPARPWRRLPVERQRRGRHRGGQPPQVEGLGLQRRGRPRHRRRLGQLQRHAHGGRRGAGRLAGDRPDGQRRRRLLIIGDLNSYDKEDPIDALLAGGYTDLVHEFQGETPTRTCSTARSATSTTRSPASALVDEVTGATEWHINADEPTILDYDMTFKQPAQDALFAPDAFRSSDHDPVIVGLDLDAIAPRSTIAYAGRRSGRRTTSTCTVEATVVATDNVDPTRR